MRGRRERSRPHSHERLLSGILPWQHRSLKRFLRRPTVDSKCATSRSGKSNKTVSERCRLGYGDLAEGASMYSAHPSPTMGVDVPHTEPSDALAFSCCVISSDIVFESCKVFTRWISSSKDPVDSERRRRISSSRSASFFLPEATCIRRVVRSKTLDGSTIERTELAGH